MYGLKYIVEFFSVTKKDVRILISEKNYSGNSSVIPSTSSVKLDFKEDDYVKGSALTMTLVSNIDGGLQEFYTTDNKKYKAEVYIDNIIEWSGFILPELYSESCIAPPYDVNITATDALATLKNYTYKADNINKSLIRIIKDCISKTTLELDFEILNSIRYSTMAENQSIYQFININDATYNGKNMYDVLTSIMRSTNATVRQKNNKWYIYRDFDLAEGRDVMQISYSTLEYVNKRDIVVNDFGNARENKNYPVGFLNMQIIPAKHILETELTYLTKPSFLLNYDFSQGRNWWTSIAPAPTTDWINFIEDIEVNGITVEKNVAKLKSKDATHPGILQEIIGVKADGTVDNPSKFTLKIEFATQNALDSSYFDVEIKNYNKSQTKYLTTSGWSDKQGYIKFNCTDETYAVTVGADIIVLNDLAYNTSAISFQNIPLSGFLSVKITWCGKVPWGGYNVGDAWPKLFIKNIFLYKDNLINTIKAKMLLNETATTDAEAIKIDFADSIVSTNEDFTFINYINNNNKASTNGWSYKNITNKDYFSLISNDYANKMARKFEQKKGVLNNHSLLNCDILKDTFNNKRYKIKSLGVNLYTDNSDVTLDEYFDYNDLYSTEVEGQTTSGSGSGSSSGQSGMVSGIGGYAPYTHDHAGQLIRPQIFVMPNSAPAEGTMEEGELAFYYTLEGDGGETPGGGGGSTIVVDDHLDNSSTNPVQNKVIVAALRYKVDAVIGKGLSTNDFTNEYKKKIDDLGEGGGTSITIDSALSSTSENPVQNKVIAKELDKKLNITGGTITGSLTVNQKLKMGTLVIPNSAPTDLSSGEVAFYFITSGTGAETPGLPADWIGDYYTKTEIDNKLNIINGRINTLANRVTALENS